MSNHLISAVYKRDLRTAMRKSVMALLADKASDDGAGIYASKQTMADELCCSKQAVIDTIKGFLADGLLVELGTRRAPNGHTVEYGIVVEALEAVPLVDCHAKREARRSASLTGQPAGPVKKLDRSSRPTPPVNQVDPNPPEPIVQDAPHPSRRVRTGKTKIPADWQVPSVEHLPPKAQACARQWTDAAYATHGEAFVSYWRGTGRMMTDWSATWANRVVHLHGQVMRDLKFGNAPVAPPADAPARPQSPAERAALTESHASLMDKLGRTDDAREARRRAADLRRAAA